MTKKRILPEKDKILIFLLFFSVFITISNIQASNSSNNIHYQIPVIECFDLNVDGSITPVEFSQTEKFSYVTRVIWDLHWYDNSIDFDDFGDDSPLTNGIALFHNDISLLCDNISTIHEFSHSGFESRIDEDDKNPIENHLVSTNSFWKYIPPYGLYIEGGRDLKVIVQDNITLETRNINHFQIIIEGFLFDSTVEKKAPPPNLLSDINDFAVAMMSEPIFWFICIATLLLIIKLVIS